VLTAFHLHLVADSTSAYDEVNNRLGIGTTSPLYSFDINSGRARVAGNNGIVGAIGGTNYGLSVQNNAAASWIEILNNGGANKGAFFGVNSNNFEMWNYQGGAIDFYTDVTATSGFNRMRINTNGNILVNTTTDAGYKLDVNGTARANQFQLSALNTAPATSTSTGTTAVRTAIINPFKKSALLSVKIDEFILFFLLRNNNI